MQPQCVVVDPDSIIRGGPKVIKGGGGGGGGEPMARELQVLPLNLPLVSTKYY